MRIAVVQLLQVKVLQCLNAVCKIQALNKCQLSLSSLLQCLGSFSFPPLCDGTMSEWAEY